MLYVIVIESCVIIIRYVANLHNKKFQNFNKKLGITLNKVKCETINIHEPVELLIFVFYITLIKTYFFFYIVNL